MTTAKTRSTSETLLAPTLSKKHENLEYSIHTLPNSLKHELDAVFPDIHITRDTRLLLVPTFQKASIELLAFGAEEASEKDRLLESFFTWAEEVRNAIKSLRHDAWVEVTDPASGCTRWGSSGGVYSDVDGVVRCLRYDPVEMGGCKIIRHPRWGFAVYPGMLSMI